MGVPIIGKNVLNNAAIPAGQTATVTGFNVQGTSQVVTPGSPAVTLTSPSTGQPMGTLTMAASGAYTFTPLPSYVGPAPLINVYSRTSNGLTTVSSLAIDVAPRKPNYLSLTPRALLCIWTHPA